MRSRHKIPSVFNLSMVDVMCCALGCVIFLWSQYMATARSRKAEADRLQKEADRLQKEAAENARRSGETAKLLDQARSDLEKLRKMEADLEQLVKDLKGQLSDANKLANTHKQKAEEAERKHQQALSLIETHKTERERLKKDVEKLEKDGQSQQQMITSLKNQIEDHLKALKEAEKHLKEEKEKLEKTIADLKTDLGKKETALRDAGKTIEKFKSEAGEQARERDELKKDNERLKRKFAGIELDGQRVIFLVDKSGSMAFIRGTEKDPNKWPTVCETVLRIMKSLPDLKEFQLITFSTTAEFPLKKKGEWLRYDEKTSLRDVEQALKAINPDGGTNLHDGLESAFAYREKRLDTIYLFSDGLPSLGAGLTQQEQNLPEGERARKLSEYLRKTLKEKWNTEKQGQPRVRIQAVGFYYESPDVGAFLWALAREHGGSFVGMNKP